MEQIENLFLHALDVVCKNGYEWEINYVQNIPPIDKQDSISFFREYVWVVLNAGMKEQVARKIFDAFFEKLDFEVIGHIGKREAIKNAALNYDKLFSEFQNSGNKIEYLDTLPWIGPITKYHLARNIGIDTVKPDRHLVRLAKVYGFSSPMDMCLEIQKTFGERVGVIDVILWRYCNLTHRCR